MVQKKLAQRNLSQRSTYSEKTGQNQLKINPQQEEEEKSLEDGERVQSSQEEQREENRTPEELFLEHFTAEPVRDETLEETMSERLPPATRTKNGSIWKYLKIA